MGATWVHLGVIVCHVEANLGLSLENLGTLGLALGFKNLAKWKWLILIRFYMSF